MGSKIEWTKETWNPIIGCSRASVGCNNCYAERMAYRLANMGTRGYDQVLECSEHGYKPRWNGQTVFIESELRKPFKFKAGSRVFVCSMSDLFHPTVKEEWLNRIFAVMALNPSITFQIVTKHPERMMQYLCSGPEIGITRAAIGFDPEQDPSEILLMPPYDDVWLGTTVQNQEQADKRMRWLLRTPAAVRFASVEPMLGPVDVSGYIRGGLAWGGFLDGLDWVICGCESGPRRRLMQVDWAVDLRRQCKEAEVAFFMKQMADSYGRVVKHPRFFPEYLRVREFPETER